MYLEFKAAFDKRPLVSLVEIHQVFPSLDKRRLTEWHQKGYLENVKRGFYRFSDQSLTLGSLCFIANKIYRPSYVSLESALAFYEVIPETVFSITSISSLNTAQFATPVGIVSYQHLKSSLYFGYELNSLNGHIIAMAKPEKAILDYLYLHSEIKAYADFEALRWNKEILKSLDFQRFSDYLQLFNSKSVSRRYQVLLNYMHD